MTQASLEKSQIEAASERHAADTANRETQMRIMLRAASHALRSYEYGNASPELAKGIADEIDALLAKT